MQSNRCRVWQTGWQVLNFNATAAMATLMEADMLGRFYNPNRHMSISGANNPELYTCYHKCLHSLHPCQRDPAMKKIHIFQKMYNSPQSASRVYFISMLSLLTCKNCDCTLRPGVLQPRFQSRYQTRFDFEGGGADDHVILVDNSFANYSHLRVSIY